MTNDEDLQDIERRAFRSYLEDGGWDLFMGIMMLGAGLRIYTDNVWFTLWLLVAVPVMMGIKHGITVPRLGKVQFSVARQDLMTKVTVMVTAAVVATAVVLGLAMAGFDLPEHTLGAAFVVLVVLIFAALAHFMAYNRIFVYGLLLAGCMAVSEFVGDHPASIAYMACGIAVIAAGVVTVYQFVQRYPLVDAEALNGPA
jgi:hypothetical protein